MQIRRCSKADITSTGDFYNRVGLWLDSYINYLNWIYGVYPSVETVKANLHTFEVDKPLTDAESAELSQIVEKMMARKACWWVCLRKAIPEMVTVSLHRECCRKEQTVYHRPQRRVKRTTVSRPVIQNRELPPEMPENASGQINYESEQGAKELAYESENYVFSEQYTQFSTTRLRSEMEVVPIPLPYSTWSFDDPYFGMQTAMTRIDIEWPMDGEDPMRQKEDAKLSLEKLLKGYTINAAKQLRVDDVVGSIEAGKSANYNVYDVNLFDVPEDEFQYVLPTLVVFEGRVLFGN